LLAVATVLGCESAPGVLRIPAEYKLDRKDVLLVIPFSDPALSYFESRTGCELADEIVNVMKMNAPRIKAVSGMELRPAIRNLDYTKHHLRNAAAAIEANRVLVGEIIELETNLPKSPNIMQGKIVVHITLHDVSRWQPPLFEKQATYIFPEDEDWANKYITTQDMLPREMLANLVSLSAQRIAEVFYAHEKLKGGPRP